MSGSLKRKERDPGDSSFGGAVLSGIRGVKPWLSYQNTSWISTGKTAFLVKSREELYCPECGSTLCLRDHKRRIWRKEGGETRWLMIGRYRCTNEACRRLHSALPVFLSENKHYDNGLIEDVIEGVVGEADPGYEDHPCGMTMMRWRSWFVRNLAAIEGQIRSAGVRILDLTEEFLGSTESLLEELRKRISPGWLKAVLVVIYNSGGRLAP